MADKRPKISQKRCPSEASDDETLASGPQHVLEHCSRLSKDNDLTARTDHYYLCVLAKDEDLEDADRLRKAELYAEAELKDVLATVELGVSKKRNGTSLTAEALKALDDDIGTQVMSTDEQFAEEVLDNDIKKKLTNISGKTNRGLWCLYDELPGYRNEASRRYRAVLMLMDKIPPEVRKSLAEYDGWYRLLKEKLSFLFPDPRTELVQEVAFYHWYLKNDLIRQDFAPLI